SRMTDPFVVWQRGRDHAGPATVSTAGHAKGFSGVRKNGRAPPADAGHGPFLRSVLAAQLFGPSVMGVVVPDRCQVAVKAEPELASGPTPSSEMNPPAFSGSIMKIGILANLARLLTAPPAT